MNVSTADHDDLVFRLYGCCAEPSHWGGTLDAVCAAMGSHSAVVQHMVVDGDRAQTHWLAQSASTDMGAYERVVSGAGNPRMEARRLSGAVGRVIDDDDLFAPDERPLRQRLQVQLDALGLGRFLGALMPLGPQQYVALALHGRAGDPRGFSVRQRALLATLMPHVAQAFSLTQALAASCTARLLLQGPLQHWPIGLLVCDREGHVLWINGRARALLHGGADLSLSHGMLQAATTDAQKRLQHALLHAGRGQQPTVVALQVRAHRWHLAVHAMDDDARLVALSGDAPVGTMPPAALAELFGLTGAESRLASALVAGFTIEQYAGRNGVTVGTARYQLKQVLSKTGSSRQADLVRRVLCSAALQLLDGTLSAIDAPRVVPVTTRISRRE